MGNEQITTEISAKEKIKTLFSKFKNPRFTTAYIAKIAILTAISFLLYAFGKFNLPFIFPQFLEIQISELPALLAGFSMGPVSGCLVIVLKCLFKFPMTSTAYVGEATDILLGILFVLPASIIYHRRKDKKHALVGICVGGLLFVAASIIVNRYISVPFFVRLYFDGNFGAIVGMLQPLYKNVTEETFYVYYLFAGVLPFNLLRCIIVGALTFVLYKRLTKILHWDGTSIVKHTADENELNDETADNAEENEDTAIYETENAEISADEISGTEIVETNSVEETYALAKRIADTLIGGEVILLDGDLGAGKTTFTKGLAKALDVSEEVTSPTFTILNVYESGRLKLNHLDMYRVECEDDLVELGVEEAIADDGVTVIEWNKFERLNGKIIRIRISSRGENERVFEIEK